MIKTKNRLIHISYFSSRMSMCELVTTTSKCGKTFHEPKIERFENSDLK